MSLSKRFMIGFQWHLIGQIAFVLIGLVYSAVIARALGPNDYGLYVSIFAVLTIIPLLINLGLEQTINVRLPGLMVKAEKAGKGNVVYFVRTLFSYRLIISLCAGIILYFCAPQLALLIHQAGISSYLRLASIYVVFTGLIGFLSMVFIAQLKIKLTRTLGIFQRITALFIAYILLKAGFRINGILYATIITSILTFSIYFFFSKSYLFSKSVKFNLSRFYTIGITAWLIGFVSYALGKQTDILLLNYFRIPTSEIGFYNIAFTLTLMLSFLKIGSGPIFQSIFSETYEKRGVEGLAGSWYIAAKIGSLLFLPLFAFALFYAPSIITIIYGSEYRSASAIFRIFALFKIVSTLANASFAMPVFYLINKKAIGLYLRISAGVLNLILDVVLIPRYGILGAIFATGFSTALIGLLEIGVVIKTIKAKLPLIFDLKILLIFSIALLPTLLIKGETVIPLILKGFIYGIISISLMMILKPIEEQDKQFVKSASESLYRLLRYF